MKWDVQGKVTGLSYDGVSPKRGEINRTKIWWYDVDQTNHHYLTPGPRLIFLQYYGWYSSLINWSRFAFVFEEDFSRIYVNVVFVLLFLRFALWWLDLDLLSGPDAFKKRSQLKPSIVVAGFHIMLSLFKKLEKDVIWKLKKKTFLVRDRQCSRIWP